MEIVRGLILLPLEARKSFIENQIILSPNLSLQLDVKLGQPYASPSPTRTQGRGTDAKTLKLTKTDKAEIECGSTHHCMEVWRGKRHSFHPVKHNQAHIAIAHQ